MNGLRRSGWKYWDHFQTIHPGASAKGKNAFSAAQAIPDLIIEGSGLPSDGEDSPSVTPVIATPITSSAPPPNSALGTTTAAASSKCPLSFISADGSVGESVPPLSTVVSEGSTTYPKKTPKSVAGSSIHSSSHSLPSRVSSFSRSGSMTASQKVLKLSQAAAFIKLKHLMAGFWIHSTSHLRTLPQNLITK